MTSRPDIPTWSRTHNEGAFLIGIALGVVLPLPTLAGFFFLGLVNGPWYLPLLLWPVVALAIGLADRRWRWVLAAAVAPAPLWTLLLAPLFLVESANSSPMFIDFLARALVLPTAGAAGAAIGVGLGQLWLRRAARRLTTSD